MALTSEIVTAALRKIGVVAFDEPATSEMMERGIETLNRMMHAWKLRGVDLEHVDLAGSDAFSLADEFHEGTIYVLAERLSPEYNRPVTFDADDWFRSLQAAYATVGTVAIPKGLLSMPSQYWPNKMPRR